MPVRFNNQSGMGVAANSFTGIDESAGYHNADLAVAADARNVDTAQGIFRPMPGFKPFPVVTTGGTTTYPSIGSAITRVMGFYRRNHSVEDSKSVCLIATQSALYCWYDGLTAWQRVTRRTPVGESTELTFTSGDWSSVTYEVVVTTTAGGVTTSETVDALILTNASDGMYILYGDSMTCDAVDTSKLPKIDGVALKFSQISRHNERIWATGADAAPDNVYYSRPYDALDWTIKTDATTGQVLPEESGGEISLPTWDGDRFIGLRRFSNYLILFKRNTVFYVKGMTAGEFQTGEAYGSDGLFAANSIVNDTGGIVYLADDGLGYYNGDTAQMMDNDRLASVFRRLGAVYEDTACSAIFRHVVYAALPVKTISPAQEGVVQTSVSYVEPDGNNMLVLYDMRRGTYMKRPGLNITSIIRFVDRVLFTMGSNPGCVYQFDGTTQQLLTGANTITESPVPVEWVSAWQDGGRKDMVKNTFTVYLTGVICVGEQNVTVTIETERKSKSKTIALTNMKRRQMVRISCSGKRWRLKISASSTIDWEIGGGVQVDMETELD